MKFLRRVVFCFADESLRVIGTNRQSISFIGRVQQLPDQFVQDKQHSVFVLNFIKQQYPGRPDEVYQLADVKKKIVRLPVLLARLYWLKIYFCTLVF
jgi:hypothetical protein